jgi:hypothetical protein
MADEEGETIPRVANETALLGTGEWACLVV